MRLTRLVGPLVLLAALAYGACEWVVRRSHDEVYPDDNWSQIEDGLFLGGMISRPPPGTRAVLNVCETRDRYGADAYEWHAIPDGPPGPGLAWLRERVAFVDAQRRTGRSVYVHCRAGVSRSPMVVAAYLMQRDGLTRDAALEAIALKRPRIGPAQAFLDLLAEHEADLRRR